MDNNARICYTYFPHKKRINGGRSMKNQFRGIALILIGIQLAIFTIIDPWLLILGGDFGRVLIPIMSVVVSVIGLILCFKNKSDN